MTAADPVTDPTASAAGTASSGVDAAALALGDDALVLAQRLGEWAGDAPVLEEEVALGNIALDLLGQARVLLSLADPDRDEDELAFLREERAFRNVQLVEQPNGDFAATIVRQLLFSAYQHPLYAQLAGTGHRLAPLAGKAVMETAYHLDHAEQWTLRLGDGTEESHRRTQRALDSLWRYTGELFQPVTGLDVDLPALRASWTARVTDTVTRAGLRLPEGPQESPWAAGGGRQGVHTEPMGRLLAEMQHLHRSHPGASW
ncbi:phenylacetate-CoA oxygenase subunit PaaC [Streptomyces sp. 549]|uniref:1,2-phenylacetyl-CoA epoxidase subunit PaaC n=1 Tax=Streptomyces sp. 549 TaxID=3049076 RepID=UPI0024C20EDA|nr:1,2-phenylacetyl-CoA epoxidase subunit PaaC [Streptomyces sp. 549]MDK1473235.1 phenylacetate-CoA oxygenase subunit PaaC [Streptomyces sp. 549]